MPSVPHAHGTSPRLATCEKCGKQYTIRPGDRGRFCSNACRQNRVEKTCPHCGKTFAVMASKAAKYQYCSQSCSRAANPRYEIHCETCGKVFEVQARHAATARFCSYACRYAASRVTITCAYCSKQRTITKHRAEQGQQCCSNRCATLYRMACGFTPGYLDKKIHSGYRTDIEAMVEEVLIRLNIAYRFEYKVSRYCVDFALPAFGIALECDGWQHFTERGKKRDAIRDAALLARGWRPVHLADRAIRTDAMTAVCEALGVNLTQVSLPLPL